MTQTFTQTITYACTHTIPIKNYNQVLTMPWWSKKLEQLKREFTTRKTRIRYAAPVRRGRVVALYLDKKEEYETQANRAKVESWKDSCSKQDIETIWDGIYRVIGKARTREEDLPLLIGGRVLDAKGSVKVLAETFYPEDLTENYNTEHCSIRARAEAVNDD